MEDCPRCRLNQRLAQEARAIADAMLIPVNALTRLPPGTVQGFVEGTTTGAVEAAKAPKGKKSSAYARAYKRAFKRQSKKYLKTNGGWKQDGFRRAVKAAHNEVKSQRRRSRK